ncbi:MAG: hypothetical protein R3E67_01590 [Pseudomonadales bacterium]
MVPVLVEHMLATSMALPVEMLHAAAGCARTATASKPEIQLSFVATRAEVCIPAAAACQQWLPIRWTAYAVRPHLLTRFVAQSAAHYSPPRRTAAWLRQQHERGALIGAAATSITAFSPPVAYFRPPPRHHTLVLS